MKEDIKKMLGDFQIPETSTEEMREMSDRIMEDSVNMMDVLIRRIYYSIRDFSDAYSHEEVARVLRVLDNLKDAREGLNSL